LFPEAVSIFQQVITEYPDSPVAGRGGGAYLQQEQQQGTQNDGIRES